jgi:hypothetical protein
MQLPRTLRFPLPLAFAALALLPAGAVAQKSYTVGITAGAAIPTGTFGDVQSKGKSITGFVGFGVAELPVGLRFDGMYHTFGGRSVTPPGGGAAVQSPDLRVWGVGGNFVVTTTGSTAKPYLLAGAGYYNSKPDSPDAKARYNIGFSGGIGSTFNLGPFASIVEARFHSISRKPENGGSIHFVPVMLGIMF